MRLPLALLFVLTLGWFTPMSAAAAELPPGARELLRPAPRVSLLTFGPGEAAFTRFGHNALRVVDPETRRDVVFNFGTFRFDNPLLIVNFLTGKFQYWLSVSDYQPTLEAYRAANRSVTEQVLNLGGLQARQLSDRLWENAKPQNRAYLYDYYRDNCSTRIRDLLDDVMKGALRPRFADPGSLTLRDHTLRAVADDFWLYLGLDIAMGSYIDQPETRWSEMFLPEKLSQGLDSVMFNGVHGAAMMIKERRELHRAKGRPTVRRVPPQRTWQFMQGGVTGGLLLSFLGWEAYRRRQEWARVLLSISIGLLGLVAGTMGCLFVGLWAFTNHQVAYRNENILQCAPWALSLTWFAWGVYRANPRRIQHAYQVLWAALLASAFGLISKALPFMPQHNERIIALCLPIWGGAFFALHLMRLQISRTLPVLVEEPAIAEEQPPEEEEQVRPSWRPSRTPPSKQPPTESEKEEPNSTAPEAEPSPA
jgi:Domain of unknown function (DUF4105)